MIALLALFTSAFCTVETIDFLYGNGPITWSGISVDPDPPYSGQTATVSVNYSVITEVTTLNCQINITDSSESTTLYMNLCDYISCPIEVGNFSKSREILIPEMDAGWYQLYVLCRDAEDSINVFGYFADAVLTNSSSSVKKNGPVRKPQAK